jgi:hypothetical protein
MGYREAYRTSHDCLNDVLKWRDLGLHDSEFSIEFTLR